MLGRGERGNIHIGFVLLPQHAFAVCFNFWFFVSHINPLFSFFRAIRNCVRGTTEDRDQSALPKQGVRDAAENITRVECTMVAMLDVANKLDRDPQVIWSTHHYSTVFFLDLKGLTLEENFRELRHSHADASMFFWSDVSTFIPRSSSKDLREDFLCLKLKKKKAERISYCHD